MLTCPVAFDPTPGGHVAAASAVGLVSLHVYPPKMWLAGKLVPKEQMPINGASVAQYISS
jgi:hypothetical protein